MAEAISQEVLARAIELQRQAEATRAAEEAEARRLAAEEAARSAPRTWGGVAQDAGVQAVQTAVGLGQAAYGLANLGTLGNLDRATGFSDNFRQTYGILGEAKTTRTQALLAEAQQQFDQNGVAAGLGTYVTNPALIQDLIVSNLASLMPGAAAARTAGTAAARYGTARGLSEAATRELVRDTSERAVLRTTAGQIAGATNVDAINQIRAAGGGDDAQQLGGIGAGVLAGVAGVGIAKLTGAARLESAAANALPGGAGAAGILDNPGLIRSVLGGAVRESSEEYAQSATEQMAQNVVTPGRGLWDGVGQQAALGWLAGGVLGGGMGGAVALRSPRTETGLRASLRDLIQRENADQGEPLGGSPLADPIVPSPLQVQDTGPLDVESIDLGATPLPDGSNVESIDMDSLPLPGEQGPGMQVDEIATGPIEELQGAPAPLRSLYDITGRRPNPVPPAPPLPQVEELPAPARTGLLGVLDAQRGRGMLGGTDLFAGPLDPSGAFPGTTPAVVGQPSVETSPGQGSLDFNAPLPTWKKTLSNELGLKPASFRGKAWDQFVAAAEAAGIKPGDPGAADFLAQVSPQLAADPATAPLFAARLFEKYAPPASTEVDPMTGTLEDALAMNEDAYIQAVNPSGKATPADDIITLQVGDLSLPAQTSVVEQFSDNQGALVDIHRDGEGILYAVQNGQVLGQMEPGPEDTIINVVQSAQGRGIGTGLATAFVRANPFAQAGSFSPAGEATRRAAFRRLQAEQAVQKVEAIAQVDAPALPQEGSVPGAPGVDAVSPTIGIDQAIRKHQQLDPSASREQATAEAFMDLMADATNTELLDETFIAIKNHPAWAVMSEGQKTEVAEEFEIRYARVEGGDAGKFNRAATPVETPIGTQEFASFIARANRARGQTDPEVIPVEDVPTFEARTGQAAPPTAAGVFTGGKIYLIRQNLANVKDVAITLAHERGHHGLDALLGERLPAVMNRLWTNAATRERIKAKMKALAGNVSPEDGGLRRLAAEEVLADMLASGEKVNGDVVTKARAAIENSFAELLGFADLKMTNAEVDAILRDTGAVLRGVSPAALREENPDTLRGLTYLMGDPQSATLGDAKFSLAEADLDRVIAAANGEGGRSSRTINDVAKAAGQAALDTVTNVRNSIKDGGVFATLLDAVPLNQLVNLYGKQFSDGDSRPLHEFARLKRGKETWYNKALNEVATLRYRDSSETIKTSPMELSARMEKFRKASPAKGEAWSKLQQFSTLYRLWPESPWKDQSKLNYAEQSFTESERQAALADLNRLWKSIGPDGQKLFRESQAVYTSMWSKRFEALREELSRATGLDKDSDAFKTAYGNTIDSALQRIRTGPYSPLQRYGDYLVTVRDAKGDIAWFSGHDTKAEAETAAARLAASDYKATDDFRVAISTHSQFDWRLDGVNQETVSKLEAIARDALPAEADSSLREEVRRALVEAYLQSLPQQSFLKHASKRKGTNGFTEDAFRAFNDYSVKAARSIASLQSDGLISSKLNELQTFVRNKLEAPGTTDVTKLQRVLNAVKSQHAASLSFDRSPYADALSQGGFLWFLSSPSQLFINATQVPLVTLPRLAGSYGNTPAIKATQKALGAFVKSRGNLLGNNSIVMEGSTQRRILEDLRVRGTFSTTLSQDMAAVANGSSSAMSQHWRRIVEVAGTFMHKSEVFNRQVTALAAAELELDKQGLRDAQLTDEQVAKLADIAEEAVLTTQFDYSQTNKPKLMQGPWRKVIFQFQQHRANMLSMIAKDIRDGYIAKDATPEERESARRALAWMVGTQLALTGVAGSILAPLAFGIMDMFRDDDDLLDSRSEFLRAAPQWLSHGLLAGALDTSRVGMDSLLPIVGDRAYAPKDGTGQDSFSYYLMRNIGPWAGLVGGIYTGADKAMSGDAQGAMKGLLPAPFRDAYKALYSDIGGARDARQVVYFDPNPWDTVVGALGLRSGDRREAEELRGASYQAANRANIVKQRYLGRLAVGHALGDQDLINEAMDSVQTWNAAHPDLAIRASDIKRAVINRIRSQQNADLYGIPTARAPGESLKQALSL